MNGGTCAAQHVHTLFLEPQQNFNYEKVFSIALTSFLELNERQKLWGYLQCF
jgi:hypothetical protein